MQDAYGDTTAIADTTVAEGTGGDLAARLGVAGGSVVFTGSAPAVIRTLGDVELHADPFGGAIEQGANGSIHANGLTTTSGGSTSLTGANQVSRFSGTSGMGDVLLNNGGALDVSNVFAVNAELTNAGYITTANDYEATIHHQAAPDDEIITAVRAKGGELLVETKKVLDKQMVVTPVTLKPYFEADEALKFAALIDQHADPVLWRLIMAQPRLGGVIEGRMDGFEPPMDDFPPSASRGRSTRDRRWNPGRTQVRLPTEDHGRQVGRRSASASAISSRAVSSSMEKWRRRTASMWARSSALKSSSACASSRRRAHAARRRRCAISASGSAGAGRPGPAPCPLVSRRRRSKNERYGSSMPS